MCSEGVHLNLNFVPSTENCHVPQKVPDGFISSRDTASTLARSPGMPLVFQWYLWFYLWSGRSSFRHSGNWKGLGFSDSQPTISKWLTSERAWVLRPQTQRRRRVSWEPLSKYLYTPASRGSNGSQPPQESTWNYTLTCLPLPFSTAYISCMPSTNHLHTKFHMGVCFWWPQPKNLSELFLGANYSWCVGSLYSITVF